MTTVVYLHVGAPHAAAAFFTQLVERGSNGLAEEGLLCLSKRTRWDRIARRARAWPGHVLISDATLAGATEAQARRTARSLRPADVHVVYAARDLSRQIAAAWRYRVMHRDERPFSEFVADLTNDPTTSSASAFWRAQDPVDVLGRWSAAVPAHRIHAVIVPPAAAPAALLNERFAQLLGIDPAHLNAEPDATAQVGATEMELLRRVNQQLPSGFPQPAYASLVRELLARQILGGRDGRRAITVPPGYRAWIDQRTTRMLDGLRSAQYDVLGDLEELLPSWPTNEAVTSPDEAMLETGIAAVVGLLQGMGRIRERTHRIEDALAEPQEPTMQPIRRAAKILSGRHRSAMRLRVLYWRAMETARKLRNGP